MRVYCERGSPDVMRVAVCAEKGGVGKTTLVLGLASALALRGRTVLVVDLDTQANATLALGYATVPLGSRDVADVLEANVRGGVAAAVIPALSPDGEWPDGVYLVPSPRDALAHFRNARGVGLELRLRKALEGIDAFDVVLLDCPGDLDRLTQNALVAADLAIAVTDLEAFGLRGLADVLTTIASVHEDYGGAALAGIVPNRFDRRVADQHADLAALRSRFGERVWAPLPARSLVGHAVRARASVYAYPAWRSGPVRDVLDRYAGRLLAPVEVVP